MRLKTVESIKGIGGGGKGWRTTLTNPAVTKRTVVCVRAHPPPFLPCLATRLLSSTEGSKGKTDTDQYSHNRLRGNGERDIVVSVTRERHSKGRAWQGGGDHGGETTVRSQVGEEKLRKTRQDRGGGGRRALGKKERCIVENHLKTISLRARSTKRTGMGLLGWFAWAEGTCTRFLFGARGGGAPEDVMQVEGGDNLYATQRVHVCKTVNNIITTSNVR